MDTCVSCGAELGVGRFCLNCGHRIGEPAPPAPAPVEPAPGEPPTPAAEEPAPVDPVSLAVQAADPTPVPPLTPVPPRVRGRTKPRKESSWDPREELLPLQEVDEVRADDPLRGWAWLAWVLGAVLLVGLVFVLLEAFGSSNDGDTATDPDATAPAPVSDGSAETGGPAGVGKLRNLATTAAFAVPATAEPTTDFDGTLVAYEASQLADGNPSTAWRMDGDATGESVTLTLAEPGVVQRVGIVNGYAKQVAGVDWYPNNRRILAVTWTFDDGTSIGQTLAERPGMQRLQVPPVQTGTVTLTIESVTPPGSGNLGRDYTAISEVLVSGRRAG